MKKPASSSPIELHTVGGFVFHELGRLPRRGDKVIWEKHRFIVRKMDGRRVARLQVRSAPQNDEIHEVTA